MVLIHHVTGRLGREKFYNHFIPNMGIHIGDAFRLRLTKMTCGYK